MSPRTATANQRVRDERQEKIVQAGLEVFARKGLAATKISDIASAAGISQGLIHHYFDSKESLYTWAAEKAMRGALQAVEDVEDEKNATPWERLTHICQTMIEGMHKSPEYLLTIVQCLVNEDIPAETHKLLVAYGNTMFSKLVRLIQEGQAAQQIVAGDPQELALTFLSIIQGLVLTQFTHPLLIGAVSSRPMERMSPRVETVLRFLKP